MEKLGRNDPCSCGSGKKLKKCCRQPPSPEMLMLAGCDMLSKMLALVMSAGDQGHKLGMYEKKKVMVSSNAKPKPGKLKAILVPVEILQNIHSALVMYNQKHGVGGAGNVQGRKKNGDTLPTDEKETQPDG